MSREPSGALLSAVFVDYDNINQSLKRKNEEAAKRFAKSACQWIKAIEDGTLITSATGQAIDGQRRLVMNRCYGNPVPRRGQNATEMDSFPFIRHHFLRAGFEIIDCANSAEIRMVMDVRDLLNHDTYFDEFIILSGDSDFTPVLHRLRAHARRTIIFSNDQTVDSYKALSDGELRETGFIDFLLDGVDLDVDATQEITAEINNDEARRQIIAEVVKGVLEANAPQPLDVLAERAIRVLGHEMTVGSNWAGSENFRELLLNDLPSTVALTEQPPYFAYDVSRAITRMPAAQITTQAEPIGEPVVKPAVPEMTQVDSAVAEVATNSLASLETPSAASAPLASNPIPEPVSVEPEPVPQMTALTPREAPEEAPVAAPPAVTAETIQESIARIHQACKAPALSPPEYRAVFTLLAAEITTNKMQGVQTVSNVVGACNEIGIDISDADMRFVVDVVGENDPWFEHGASAIVFANRFRNFVIRQCQASNVSLTAEEVDLIDAWFAGSPDTPGRTAIASSASDRPLPSSIVVPTNSIEPVNVPLHEKTARWWEETTKLKEHTAKQVAGQTAGTAQPAEVAMAEAGEGADDFPRIVRNRIQG